eukprot:3385306-Amphidinium_carterae.1
MWKRNTSGRQSLMSSSPRQGSMRSSQLTGSSSSTTTTATTTKSSGIVMFWRKLSPPADAVTANLSFRIGGQQFG